MATTNYSMFGQPSSTPYYGQAGGTAKLMDPNKGYTLGNVQTIYPSAAPTPTLAPQTPTYSAGSSNSGSFDINALMKQISSTPAVTTTNTNSVSTQNQKQNTSPELEAMMKAYTNQVNQLGQATQQAYQSKSNTYADLIASLTNMYNNMGSGQSGAAATSALASGLTPLEAQQAGGSALSQVMQQYYPALASTRADQADVGIASQSALAGLMQNLNLPMMTNVAAPYYNQTAGTTGTTTNTGTSTQTNPMQQLSLLAQLAQSQQGNELGYAQLAQQGSQFQQNLAQQGALAGQSAQTDLQKLMAQLGMEQYKTDVSAQNEQSKIAANAQLQTQLQQMQGQQSLANTGLYGQNMLAQTGLQGTIQAAQAQQQFKQQQDLLKTGMGNMQSQLNQWTQKYFGDPNGMSLAI